MSVVELYLGVVNMWVFLLMGYDKYQAKHHRWRIRERTLLTLGLLGGGLGGVLGRMLFHHKTKKPRFLVTYLFGCLVMVILIYWLQ